MVLHTKLLRINCKWREMKGCQKLTWIWKFKNRRNFLPLKIQSLLVKILILQNHRLIKLQKRVILTGKSRPNLKANHKKRVSVNLLLLELEIVLVKNSVNSLYLRGLSLVKRSILREGNLFPHPLKILLTDPLLLLFRVKSKLKPICFK
jgi:hypothetical protein